MNSNDPMTPAVAKLLETMTPRTMAENLLVAQRVIADDNARAKAAQFEIAELRQQAQSRPSAVDEALLAQVSPDTRQRAKAYLRGVSPTALAISLANSDKELCERWQEYEQVRKERDALAQQVNALQQDNKLLQACVKPGRPEVAPPTTRKFVDMAPHEIAPGTKGVLWVSVHSVLECVYDVDGKLVRFSAQQDPGSSMTAHFDIGDNKPRYVGHSTR